MNTSHLASLGAREIPREEFIRRLQNLVNYPNVPVSGEWRFATANFIIERDS
jgi:leucyl/phenylalanyl-tRNA--protein transferase